MILISISYTENYKLQTQNFFKKIKFFKSLHCVSVKSSLNIVRRKINGLPALNQSQYHAVDKALNNTFTLIQGPPGRCVNLCTLMVHIFCKGLNHFLCLLGTGKTVVGVYIVHSFFEHNSKKKRKWDDPKDKEKKEVILYCGPSNKSVDVVAGKLC